MYSYEPIGYTGTVVSVEVDIRRGIPSTEVVGLAGHAVREAKDRVRVAVRNSGFRFPMDRVLVSLSPSDLPKSSAGLDLAIALAILDADGQIGGDRHQGDSDAVPHRPFDLATQPRTLAIGELHLRGHVGPVRGVIAAVAEGAAGGITRFIVPEANEIEARSVGAGSVYAVATLSQAVRALRGELPPLGKAQGDGSAARQASESLELGDFASVRGHARVKRAVEVAIAGGHHLLLVGPPGSGKSMVASLIPSVLPSLAGQEAVEVTRLYSLAGKLPPSRGLMRDRPFRAPHHGATAEGMLGGGRSVEPGEASLAHRGVLFLDEAPEFRRTALQGLREPLEQRVVRVSRAGRSYWFPAAAQLVMACNPCPCGQLGRDDSACLCAVGEIERYWRRIGGALLDRIDVRAAVLPVAFDSQRRTDSSEAMRSRILLARQRQALRYRGDSTGPALNGELSGAQIERYAPLARALSKEMAAICGHLRLSGRGAVSVRRLARTIADLDDRCEIRRSDVLEAAAHRRLGEQRPIWMSF